MVSDEGLGELQGQSPQAYSGVHNPSTLPREGCHCVLEGGRADADTPITLQHLQSNKKT